MYLKPLRHHFEDYEQAEFDESKQLFAPMMHTICMVWSNSQYYNTPARLVVLLQEICNLIMRIVSILECAYTRCVNLYGQLHQ